MEFSGNSGGFLNKVKKGIYNRIDPAAREQAREDEKMDVRESIRARQNKIKEEQSFRADVRSGKRQGSTRDYLGSMISESRNKRAIGGLEEKLDPNLKRYNAFKRREKFNNAFGKVESAFDKVGDAYDKAGDAFGNNKKNSMGFGGLDIDELAGLKGGRFGSGSPHKSSGRSKQVPIMRGKKVVGYRQVGGRKKSASRREAQDWTDLF